METEELYMIDNETNKELKVIISSEDAIRARNGKQMNSIFVDTYYYYYIKQIINGKTFG